MVCFVSLSSLGVLKPVPLGHTLPSLPSSLSFPPCPHPATSAALRRALTRGRSSRPLISGPSHLLRDFLLLPLLLPTAPPQSRLPPKDSVLRSSVPSSSSPPPLGPPNGESLRLPLLKPPGYGAENGREDGEAGSSLSSLSTLRRRTPNLAGGGAAATPDAAATAGADAAAAAAAEAAATAAAAAPVVAPAALKAAAAGGETGTEVGAVCIDAALPRDGDSSSLLLQAPLLLLPPSSSSPLTPLSPLPSPSPPDLSPSPPFEAVDPTHCFFHGGTGGSREGLWEEPLPRRVRACCWVLWE